MVDLHPGQLHGEARTRAGGVLDPDATAVQADVLGDQREAVRAELADLIAAEKLEIGHPRVLLNTLAERIERGEHDAWFEDPKV